MTSERLIVGILNLVHLWGTLVLTVHVPGQPGNYVRIDLITNFQTDIHRKSKVGWWVCTTGGFPAIWRRASSHDEQSRRHNYFPVFMCNNMFNCFLLSMHSFHY
jgi:hypothetical protein